MKLSELVANLAGARVVGDAGVAVGAVRADSRAVEPGDVFVAVRGLRADGHAYVATAIERGAGAIVVEHELPDARIPQVIVPSGAIALGVLVGRSLGDPGKAMTLVGITGTNGKTTTTYLVESMIAAAGGKPGVIGTVSYRYAGIVEDAPYTTPTPHVLHETLAKMRDAGCTHVVMEVSSAALAMDRLAGVEFAVGAFSNLTQDHLDVHGSMAAYADAKRRLFRDHLHGGVAVVNVEDPAGESMGAVAHRTLRVGPGRDISVDDAESTVRGIRARVTTPRGSIAIASEPLVGGYNVQNLALAIGIGEALGLPHTAIVDGIAALRGVPGRVERVANAADLDILVDYAHTPDALRNVLSALRPLTKRRLICVFGCGGDRDPGKRPKMGAAVAELADLAIVTSDNPRTEEPRAIIDAILPAVPKPFAVEVDRRVAIRAAICEATPGDVVVIAGKGHEDYQILGTTKHHFDDREEAAAAIADRFKLTGFGIVRATEGYASVPTAATTAAVVTRVVIDSRAVAPGDLYVAIRGETHDGHAFADGAFAAGATLAVVDRKVAGPHVLVADTRIAIGRLAHAHRIAWSTFGGTGPTRRIVAITGSAGKTTTKDLVRAALAEVAPTRAADGSLNNETGVPLTLLGLHPYHRFGVVEMGMRGAGQIEYLTRIAEPDVAVVVNAGSAHIELLGSTDAIARAKAEIWHGVRPGGTIVRPAGDPRLEPLARAHSNARHVTFGDEPTADVRLVGYTPTEAGAELAIEAFGEPCTLQLALVGRHAAIDACAALAAAHAAGASIAVALAGLARARPPSMRGEIVEVAGRRVIVDCYNANPASMAAALRTLAERAVAPHRGIAVLGDMLELGPHAASAHAEVDQLAHELGLDVIALGELAGKMAHATRAGDPAAAAVAALARAKAGDWILLKASRGMRLERVLAAMRGSST